MSTEEVTAESTKATPWWRSRAAQAALSLAVVLLIFGFFFPKLANYGEVWDTIQAMTGLEILGLVLVASWNLASYWPLLMVTLPGLRVREAAVSNLASTAVANTLPGGGALGIGVTVTMQHSWGFPIADVARAGVVAGIWNNFVKLGMPVVALALMAVTGQAGAGLVAAAAIGMLVLAVSIVGFGLLLRSDRLARAVGSFSARAATLMLRPLRRGPVQGWDEGASRFRSDTIGLLTGRMIRITAATLMSHVSLFLVLLVALRDVGISQEEVSWIEVLAAFAFVRLLSAVPVTPGGLGVVELGLTAAIGSGLDDEAKNQVAAAVLLFRALTWFAPIPIGVAAGLFWRSNISWRHSVEERRQIMNHTDSMASSAPNHEPTSS
jgi:putative heme transporter